MRIIIFDFEVFKHDTLLGALILENDNIEVFQTWSIPEIKNFYEENKQHIWIGWNNEHYDNHILQACVKDENIKRVNDYIIKEGKKRYLRLPLNFFDVMKTIGFFSLKTSEALSGKKISESEIDFELDRPLTEEEKRLTESYNLDDLEQTYESFIAQQNHFILRLDTINEFNLPLECLSMTDSMLGERVLKAKKIDNIDRMIVKPSIYDTLLIENEEVRDYFLKEKFMTGQKLVINLSSVEHTMGLGGIHGAQKKYHTKRALYFDVSGYYNLIMIKYNLLPRSIPEEGKKLYENMYYEQLTLKKTNPKKRSVLKLILLCVFGSSLNQYLNFYDPYHGRLITLTGQLFLIDLLEKLEGKIELVQSNTDGIIVVPLEGVEDKEIHDIVNEWQERTGFNLAIEEIFDVHQRDVNYYMYRKNGKIVTVGGDTKDWEKINIFSSQKEPRIIGRSVVEFFMNNKSPEQVIEEFKREAEMFQYIAKKQSFKYVELESKNIKTGEVHIEKVQNVNRAFASNDTSLIQELFKRNPSGKTKTARMQGFPNNIFIYNEEILSDTAKDYLMTKIDYQHYIDKAYKKIKEFIDIPEIKSLEWK